MVKPRSRPQVANKRDEVADRGIQERKRRRRISLTAGSARLAANRFQRTHAYDSGPLFAAATSVEQASHRFSLKERRLFVEERHQAERAVERRTAPRARDLQQDGHTAGVVVGARP